LLVFVDLRLDILLPLRAGITLNLFYSGSAILLCEPPSRRDNLLINRIVIWASQLDVWRGVAIIVWLEMRRDDLSELEIGLADSGGGIIAVVQGCGTSKKNRQDGIPRE